jgi:tetratricopeptide (TPR) repeat protein
MPAFDGLYPFEKLMLDLGAGFFVALAFVLIFLALKGRPFAKLLPFFFIPIVMMAWPSIKSVEFGNDVVTIETNLNALASGSADASAVDSLKIAVADVSARPSSDPVTLTLLARASLAIGDTQAASARVEQALSISPKFTEAAALKDRIEAEPKLQALTKQVEQEPSNEAAKQQLQQTIATVTKVPVVNPATLTDVASAQAAVGDKAQASANVNKALKINPKLAQAVQLKEKLAASPGAP